MTNEIQERHVKHVNTVADYYKDNFNSFFKRFGPTSQNRIREIYFQDEMRIQSLANMHLYLSNKLEILSRDVSSPQVIFHTVKFFFTKA